MSRTLVHRGPDGEGIWIQQNVGLAHRRLAIIDLREVANQPMTNEDGTIWVTYNGEIYNFRELKADLESRGHTFRTQSDTEVIIHAYEEYGKECLHHFRGMFAFAIWDGRSRTLLLARDRVGKKPLYYFVGPDCLVFGSEIKAILANPSVAAEPDPIALDHFLALQYIPSPYSAFQGIRKLPAAHWLELRDGQVQMGRYWRLQCQPKQAIGFLEAIEEIRRRLAEAVRLRLVSDVSLGAFLSGGIDSSAVVAYMAQEMREPVQTFSVGFEDKAFDERSFARIVADHCHTKHTEIMVNAPVEDILPRLVWHYDEPFGDASAVPSFAVAGMTSQHVRVVLNGDGGDENFAGYDWHLMNRRLARVDQIPLGARQFIHRCLQRMPNRWREIQPLRKLTRVAEVLAEEPGPRYLQLVGHMTAQQRWGLYTEHMKGETAKSDPEGIFAALFESQQQDSAVDQALNADVSYYLPDDLLVKMDRATMAHSLETRSPFLDHELLEFTATLPPSFKLAGTRTKQVLKASLRHVLPDPILDRSKMGFCVPLARWFRHELHEMAHDVLLSRRAHQRDYMKPDRIEKLLADHQGGHADHAKYLWDLLVLELWHREFIDRHG